MAVSSPAEAVRALSAKYPGFEKALMGHAAGFHVFRGRENLGGKNLKEPSGKDAIRIVPAIAGAKLGGSLQIIEGTVLIVVGAVIDYFYPGNPISTELYKFGAAMAFSGVVTFLFSPPPSSLSPNSATKNQPSYAFNGPVNTTSQGYPVPVGYGRLRVGSAVISGGIFVAQIDQNGADIGSGAGSLNGGASLRVGPTLVGVAQLAA